MTDALTVRALRARPVLVPFRRPPVSASGAENGKRYRKYQSTASNSVNATIPAGTLWSRAASSRGPASSLARSHRMSPYAAAAGTRKNQKTQNR